MSKKTTDTTAPAADAEAGAGGSYLINDATGVRTLMERTEEPRLRSREADPEAAPAAPSPSTPAAEE